MARTKFKWKFAFFSYLMLVNICAKSLPLFEKPTVTISDTSFRNEDIPEVGLVSETYTSRIDTLIEDEAILVTTDINALNFTDASKTNAITFINSTRNSILPRIRPGQRIRQYAIEITTQANSFTGRAVIDVILDLDRDDPILLHVEDLNIQSVNVGIFTDAILRPAPFDVDEGLLEISPEDPASSYIVVVEYSGILTNIGQGLYRGSYDNVNYLAMNLHPTHARRVFPCMDEPTQTSFISFTFNGLEYNNVMMNSLPEDNQPNQFRALQGPAHLWSMVAHNFNNIIVPTAGVFLYVRPGVNNQESQASLALNSYFTSLTEWSGKPYFEIVLNQAEQLSVLALPDVSRDWYGLSTVALWEAHVLMENTCSIKQRYVAYQKMSETLAKQWFGHVIYPENWRYQWVTDGLASYAGFDAMKIFQTSSISSSDITLLDVDTLFVTEIIQESLFRDTYQVQALELREDIFEEGAIREYIYGIQKYKSPAILRMFRLVLGDENSDFIQMAGRSLVRNSALQTVNTLNFIDAIKSNWLHTGDQTVGDLDEYIEPWIQNNGCPLITVSLRQGGVFVTQEHFAVTEAEQITPTYSVPITYTISSESNYDNIRPITMMNQGAMLFNMRLDDEDDYTLFNIQGQGYYRVNYDNELWERIIAALDDPERRNQIHPLNRATLIDDSLNLARMGILEYDVALRVVLTMQHETEYAPWRAFIRNMNFLKKRLEALVINDEDLDPDIYLRMIRRTIGTFESEIGFTPDPLLTESAMTSLTRGLVMDHACRAGYQPCIAAAVDWFYDPNSAENVVNPNIPSDIRPAVYCTMVREGGQEVIDALYTRLEIETNLWERTVILQSFTCSRENNVVDNLLMDTIADVHTTEEKSRIFIAAAESSYESARSALSFITNRVVNIRNVYGGAEKLEELLSVLADNMSDLDLSFDFQTWVNSQTNMLEDSQEPANAIVLRVVQNREWLDTRLNEVYEWIDENDAPTLMVSLFLISISLFVAIFNH